ncbi:MAG: GGDEF domain-containing protein [Nitrosomonas sp.]|nr:GGDEF domain-containing protein [Nitrosomonas sp.]
MNSTVHEQNRLLQNKLNNLIKKVRDNERKQALYETFGFEIIGANTPKELRDLLLSEFIARFQLMDVVLCLVDQHQDAERLFSEHGDEERSNYAHRLLIVDPVKDAGVVDSLIKEPLLGTEVLKKYQWMVSSLQTKAQTRSAAYLPLLRSERIIGALLLLSHDSNRFPQGVGTFFLQKLSMMAAVAIENCLNQQRIREISYQDVLTQIYNRRYFDLRLKDEIARSLRWDDDLVCMFLDVDYFKRINDQYGHQTGDQVLVCVADLIRTHVRACDIVARYGGEEFVVALPATTLQFAHEIAERLRQTVFTMTHRFRDEQFRISISIGMANLRNLHALVQQDGQKYELIGAALLGNADKALYQAKAAGRNRIVIDGGDT